MSNASITCTQLNEPLFGAHNVHFYHRIVRGIQYSKYRVRKTKEALQTDKLAANSHLVLRTCHNNSRDFFDIHRRLPNRDRSKYTTLSRGMSPSTATSYGQVIEYIKGMRLGSSQPASMFDPVPTLSMLIMKRHNRPSLSRLLHSSSQCIYTVPVPHDDHKNITQAIFEITKWPNTSPCRKRSQSPPTCVLLRRRKLVVQCLPRRLWSTAHWSPL